MKRLGYILFIIGLLIIICLVGYVFVKAGIIPLLFFAGVILIIASYFILFIDD